MTGTFEAGMALLAATMMAVSPVTGGREGRVIQLCHPDGLIRKMLIWDEEAPQPVPTGDKACHACVMEKRKQRSHKK